eukprot:TRINITY_DN2055_c0_g1_i1.p1 TRINITY_DN2055_c0_g1~~TRINITY_DN2055_c0_g1_i1.p1  ORF type:complete len:285 (+),score=48.90 TRINITY_DN2055_c0_g1_i1:740-1594(+)
MCYILDKSLLFQVFSQKNRFYKGIEMNAGCFFTKSVALRRYQFKTKVELLPFVTEINDGFFKNKYSFIKNDNNILNQILKCSTFNIFLKSGVTKQSNNNELKCDFNIKTNIFNIKYTLKAFSSSPQLIVDISTAFPFPDNTIVYLGSSAKYDFKSKNITNNNVSLAIYPRDTPYRYNFILNNIENRSKMEYGFLGCYIKPKYSIAVKYLRKLSSKIPTFSGAAHYKYNNTTFVKTKIDNNQFLSFCLKTKLFKDKLQLQFGANSKLKSLLFLDLPKFGFSVKYG